MSTCRLTPATAAAAVATTAVDIGEGGLDTSGYDIAERAVLLSNVVRKTELSRVPNFRGSFARRDIRMKDGFVREEMDVSRLNSTEGLLDSEAVVELVRALRSRVHRVRGALRPSPAPCVPQEALAQNLKRGCSRVVFLCCVSVFFLCAFRKDTRAVTRRPHSCPGEGGGSAALRATPSAARKCSG